MDKLIVHGGSTLHGAINISGSKNASLPILAATLLTDKACIIRRVPDVSDANYMVQILSALGADVERSSGTVRISCTEVGDAATYELVRRMRASICVMGPLLARKGRAVVSLPGGCVIGDRPVDLHLRGLEALGAKVSFEQGNIVLTADKGLKGAVIDLRGTHGSTVLGTDNVMMAATLAEGTTVIESAAAEPEVVDLAEFLNAMGAKISGAGTARIVIEGVGSLHGTEHTVIPDRIEAGTFLAAAALAGDQVRLHRVRRDHLTAITRAIEESGHKVLFNDAGDSCTVHRGETTQGVELVTSPYPGYPTDMQAQMTALLATTPGISVIKDTIFPQRFMHCAELKRMGADIHVDNGSAVVRGVRKLSAAPVMASDLRASAALVLAALTAEGPTEINRLYHIDRGYEHIDEKLLQLGANLQRVKSRPV
jgi:UDP-N-acetylglucosamine 1-carboxyvinyltransferase